MRGVLLFAFLAACGSQDPSYFEIHGALGDGTPVDGRFYGITQPGAPWKLQATVNGPGDLRGFWLWFDPTVTATAYPSTGSDPNSGAVHFFFLRRGASDLMNDASLVDGGQIRFASVGPDDYAGSLAALTLIRNGQTLATVTSGSFLAARPR